MFNPFDHVNWDDVKRRVDNMRAAHPEWTNADLVRECTKEKVKWAVSVGVAANVTSVFPGIGTTISLVGGTALELKTLTSLLTELVCEVAYIYGRRPATDVTSREAFFVLSSALGADAAALGATKYAVMHASKRAFLRLVQRLLTRIGVIVTQKTIARFIPLVGCVIGGTANASICWVVSRAADRWYRENPEQDAGWGLASTKD